MIILIGMTSLWVMIVPLAILTGESVRRIRWEYGGPLTIICGIVVISGVWGEVWSYPLVWTSIVLMIWIISDRIRFDWRLALAGMVIIGMIGVWQMWSGDSRARGINSNASLLGLMGVALWPIGAPLVVMSLSRTALVVALVLTAANYSRWGLGLFVVAAIGVGVLGMIQTPERYGVSGVGKMAEMRLATFDGSTVERTSGLCGEVRNVEWRWYGYGFGSYCYATGRALPHNIFVLLWYELGVLSLLFWIGVLWLIYKVRPYWGFIVGVGIIGVSGPELLSRIEGLFVIAGMYLSSLWLRRANVGQIE